MNALIGFWNSLTLYPAWSPVLHFYGPQGEIVQSSPDINVGYSFDQHGLPRMALAFPNGGQFVVELQVGLLPGSGAGNFLWQRHTGSGEDRFLLPFQANAGYPIFSSALTVRTNPGEAFQIAALNLTAPVEINPDRRASRLSIWKLP